MENIITNKDLRKTLLSRVEVLEKVKELALLPKLDMMTLRQVANYFEVDADGIRRCVQRHRDELTESGVVVFNKTQLKELNVPLRKVGFNDAIVCENGILVPTSNFKTMMFSLRAILNIGMLITKSSVAREVRRQLLNVWENSDTETRIKEINAEEAFISNIGRASVYGDKAELSLAWKDYADYLARHIANLEVENNLLVGKTQTWDSRKILNALIRALSSKAYGNNFSYGWEIFYRELRNKYSISPKNRVRGAQKLLDTIKDDEWKRLIEVATALCVSAGVNLEQAVNKQNLKIIEVV